MKIAAALALALPFLQAGALAQAPTPKPVPAKLAAKDVRELPFCREFKEQVFKANEKGLGDELHVAMAAGVHLSGKKRGDVKHFGGRPICHVGKVALMPVGTWAGKLTVKAPSAEDVTYYYAALETAAGTLDTKPVTLEVGKVYTWSLKTEGGQTTLLILDGAKEAAILSAPEAGLKGFGFAATVRYKGNEADLLATFD